MTPHLASLIASHPAHLRWVAACLAAGLLWLATGLPARAADAVARTEADLQVASAAPAGDSLQMRTSTLVLGGASPLSSAAGLAPQVTAERSNVLPPAGSWPGASPVDAFGRSYLQMGGVSYRFWSRHRRSAVGLGVGTLGYVVTPPSSATDPAAALTLAYPASTVTLGWRYQTTDYSTLYADASSARRSANDTTADYYNAKVGVEWQSRSSRLGFDRGVLGLQLDSGYRMSLRVKHGMVALYLKGQF